MEDRIQLPTHLNSHYFLGNRKSYTDGASSHFWILNHWCYNQPVD